MTRAAWGRLPSRICRGCGRRVRYSALKVYWIDRVQEHTNENCRHIRATLELIARDRDASPDRRAEIIGQLRTLDPPSDEVLATLHALAEQRRLIATATSLQK